MIKPMIGNDTNLRSNIIDSWDRCLSIGLNPDDVPKKYMVSAEQLQTIIDENKILIDCANPYIQKVKTILHFKQRFLGLCNKDSVVFYTDGETPLFCEAGWQEGCILSEEYVGNNAMGTCIQTGEPTIIMGYEHYLTSLHGWTGYATPIHNEEKEIIAAIGVNVPGENTNEGILGMLMMAARGIEKELSFNSQNSQLSNITEVLSEYNQGIINTASMLSHEIKNALSTISAYIQLLQLEKALNYDKGNRILKEITRANKLLDDFRRLTKPVKFNFSSYSLQEILQSVVEMMQSKAKIHHVLIELRHPEKPIKTHVDKDAIQQVFVNLIENAIQAMETGGLLRVELVQKKYPSMNRIIFEDNGIGIPEENLGDIFKLFYTTKKTGTGLGLSLCASIIKGHGGEIFVESVFGEKTTFTIELPAMEH